METGIALFRGVNVGGHNKLPMKELKTFLQPIGLEDVRTYIQSGNLVFRHQAWNKEALSTSIQECVSEHFGFRPQVMLLTLDEWQQAIENNPFPEANATPAALHYYFLESLPGEVDLSVLEKIKKENESFTLRETVFYLHAPDGIGRSKLAERVEKTLGVAVTARNARTVTKLLEMASE